MKFCFLIYSKDMKCYFLLVLFILDPLTCKRYLVETNNEDNQNILETNSSVGQDYAGRVRPLPGMLNPSSAELGVCPPFYRASKNTLKKRFFKNFL